MTHITQLPSATGVYSRFYNTPSSKPPTAPSFKKPPQFTSSYPALSSSSTSLLAISSSPSAQFQDESMEATSQYSSLFFASGSSSGYFVDPSSLTAAISHSSSSVTTTISRHINNSNWCRLPPPRSVILSTKKLQSLSSASGSSNRVNLRRDLLKNKEAAILKTGSNVQIPAELPPPVAVELIVSNISKDALVYIVAPYLSPCSLASLFRCTRSFYNLINGSPIWKKQVIKTFGNFAGRSKLNLPHWINVYGLRVTINNSLARKADQRIEITAPALPILPALPETAPTDDPAARISRRLVYKNTSQKI